MTYATESENTYGKFTTTLVDQNDKVSNFWVGQIRQENIRLPQGSYTLEFKARAAAAHTIRVALAGGGMMTTGRAINEVPVLLSTEWETYTFDFTTDNHSYGSLLQFFTGPDKSLASDGEFAAYIGLSHEVHLDDVVFRYGETQTPVPTFIPTLASDVWRIGAGEDGMPWENQLKYANMPFYAGTYRLTFKAYAEDARNIIIAMEGNGGVDHPGYIRRVSLTNAPQEFSFDVEFAADSVNASKNIQFFMGSMENYAVFGEWWPLVEEVSAADNVETLHYFFDFAFTKIA
jgi:hypothetical protein